MSKRFRRLIAAISGPASALLAYGMSGPVPVIHSFDGAYRQSAANPKLTATNLLKRDAFYDPPASVPDKPGMLIRSEPLTDRTIPSNAKAWRILYTTTLAEGRPAISSGLVIAPANPPAGPRPVVMFEHGTMGIAERCVSSLQKAPMRSMFSEGIGTQAIAEGWVIVANDYALFKKQGSSAFFVGEAEARSAFDSVRAARQMKELTLDRDRTIVVGHSQGGHSALWTGALAWLAPDVTLSGVVAVSPGSDVARIVTMRNWDEAGWTIASYALDAYSQYYRDVKLDEILNPAERVVVQKLARLCAADPPDVPQINAAVKEVKGKAPFDITQGAFGKHLAEQKSPTTPIAAPLLIVHGVADPLVNYAVNDDYVKERCASGQNLEYWKFTVVEHQDAVGRVPAPHVIRWMKARFDGKPRTMSCQSKAFSAN